MFVRNLPLDLLAPELESVFAEVGPVKKASVIHHKKAPGDGGQTSRGFGFVKFAVAADAEECIRQLHGTKIRGRAISVELTAKKGAAAGAKAIDAKAAAPAPPPAAVKVPVQDTVDAPKPADILAKKMKSKKATQKSSAEDIAANAQPVRE